MTIDQRVPHVQDLLGRYAPSPVERALVPAFRDLVDTAQPFSRRQFVPGHLTASGFVVSPDSASLLMVYHRRLGRWLQPGGHIDPGDPDPETAARREILEETGVDRLAPLIDGLFGLHRHPIPARGDEPAHHHYDLSYAYRAPSPVLGASREIADARWVPLADLDSVDADDRVRREAQKLQTLI